MRTLLAGLLICLSTVAGVRARAEEPLHPGDRGIALSVIQGNEVEEIPVVYLGTYKGFAGPGYDLHLVRLEGPVADRVGVASGMSGSPVYFGGRLIGALAYRLGSFPKEPIAGVTPVEIMRFAPRSAGAPVQGSTVLAPIATPILAGGMLPEIRQWLEPQLGNLGFVMAAGGTATELVSPELKPGSPVGIELLRGDMHIAATGTVTWVEDGNVFAFGHPFFGSGHTEMPMVAAEVIHTMGDLAGSLKLANVGQELGAIQQDRFTAVVGKLGSRARMIPLSLEVRGGEYGQQRFAFELVQSSNLAPLLAGAAIANSLQINRGNSEKTTMLARGNVRLRGLPDLSLEMAEAGGAAGKASLGVAVRLLQTLDALWSNPFNDVEVEGIDLTVDVKPEEVRYRLEDVQYDRRPLRPGQPLKIRCVLRKFRGGTLARELLLPMPAELPATGELILALGSPEQVDRALGQPLRQRLRSVPDLPSFVRALGDQRSAHRLTATIYQPGRALVSRGVAYGELPVTVERLLATTASSLHGRPPIDASMLGSAELELDGPVEGSLQIRLRIDGGLEADGGAPPSPNEIPLGEPDKLAPEEPAAHRGDARTERPGP